MADSPDKESAGIGQGTPGPGRPKGTPNRATAAVREAFRRLVEDNAEHMQEWLDATAERDPAKALDLTARLAEFIIPKLSRSDIRGDLDNRLEIVLVKQGGAPSEGTP